MSVLACLYWIQVQKESIFLARVGSGGHRKRVPSYLHWVQMTMSSGLLS